MTFVQSPTCYLAIPSGPEFAPVRQAVIDALRESHVEVAEAANLRMRGPSSPPAIEKADLVIADVTGSDRTILYELGAASALRKPTLMIAQEKTDLPADFASLQVALYRPQELPKLVEFLRYWIENTIALQRGRYAPA